MGDLQWLEPPIFVLAANKIQRVVQPVRKINSLSMSVLHLSESIDY